MENFYNLVFCSCFGRKWGLAPTYTYSLWLFLPIPLVDYSATTHTIYILTTIVNLIFYSIVAWSNGTGTRTWTQTNTFGECRATITLFPYNARLSEPSTILRQGKCSILYQSFDGSRTSTLRRLSFLFIHLYTISFGVQSCVFSVLEQLVYADTNIPKNNNSIKERYTAYFFL